MGSVHMTPVIGDRPLLARSSSYEIASPTVPDFAQVPFLVIWEVTRACALACVHCRANAIPRRDPCELTTEEGFQLRLRRSVAALGGGVLLSLVADRAHTPRDLSLIHI